MKKYLIGYSKNKNQDVIFFDIQDFEAQTIRNMTVLTFSEDNIDYTYTGMDGKDFKEVNNSAPDFYSYEVLDEKECKKRGINTNPNQSGTTQSAQSTGTPIFNINNGITITLKSGKKVNILDPNDMKKLTPAEVKEVEKELKSKIGNFGSLKQDVDVDFSKDRDNPTITFPDGSKYTLDDLQNMDTADVLQIGEDNDIDIPELISEINASIFKGITGKAKLNISRVFSNNSSSSSSSSSGCGGGYSSGSGCGGGSYRSGC